jgi:hypothetical protein
MTSEIPRDVALQAQSAPKFARVDIATLRALRELAKDDPILAEQLDHLIEVAEQRGWSP